MSVSLRKFNGMVCFLSLHVQLMDLQQKQINALAEWLTLAEQRINSSEPIGSDLDTVNRQVESHKVWHLIPLSILFAPVVIGGLSVVVRELQYFFLTSSCVSDNGISSLQSFKVH